MKLELKKNRNRSESRKERLHKLCLQRRDNILEKSSLREDFNWEWRKRIGGFITFKSFFNPENKSAKTADVDEIIFYLKPKYLTHNEEPRIFIHDIPTEEPSFEAITGYLKTFSKSINKDENMSMKN